MRKGTAAQQVEPPTQLTGKEFEAAIMLAFSRIEKAARGTYGRYGVQAVRRRDGWIIMRSLPDFEGVDTESRQSIFDAKVCSKASMSWDSYRPQGLKDSVAVDAETSRTALDSLRAEFMADTDDTEADELDALLSDDTAAGTEPKGKKKRKQSGERERQLRHMLKRSRYGVNCGFLMHWNKRSLKTKSEPAETIWLPVMPHCREYWDAVQTGVYASMTREECRILGTAVPWILPANSKRPAPYLDEVLNLPPNLEELRCIIQE